MKSMIVLEMKCPQLKQARGDSGKEPKLHRWQNGEKTLEIWFSKDGLLSNITPRFLTVEEVTVHPSSFKLWSKRSTAWFTALLSSLSRSHSLYI